MESGHGKRQKQNEVRQKGFFDDNTIKEWSKPIDPRKYLVIIKESHVEEFEKKSDELFRKGYRLHTVTITNNCYGVFVLKG